MNGFQIGHKRLKVAHKKEMPGERNNGFGDEMNILLPRSPQGIIDPRNLSNPNGFIRSNSNPTIPPNHQYDVRYSLPNSMPNRNQQPYYHSDMNNLDQSMASLNMNNQSINHQRPPLPQQHQSTPYGYPPNYQSNYSNQQQQQQYQQYQQLQQLQLQQQ
eukprot:491150_1